jgi:hypothetical protein
MTGARPPATGQRHGGETTDRMLSDGLDLQNLQLDAPSMMRGEVEWLVADVSLARAFFEGVPAARLLARTRLASDERDLLTSPLGSTPVASTWDTLMKRLLAKSGTRASSPGTLPPSASGGIFERVKRQVARQTRAASDEGPLEASPGVVAALVCAVASAQDMDASLAEIVADAHEQLGVTNIALYPRDRDPEIAPADRHMVLVERGELDVLMTRDPRELAAIVARIEDGTSKASPLRPPAQESRGLDSLLADLGKLLAHAGDLLLALPLPDPPPDDEAATPTGGPTSLPSWLPTTWSSPEAGAALAEAFERGSMTLPRMRAAVLRGGDQALDALGAEMLRAAEHPFASAAFAELLARSGRARDVVRLVTYFAVAPDPELAARALSTCPAPELPTVLRSWLEAMLPTDGEPALLGEDPQTSSAARLTACVSSLAPYPHLYRAVRPLLARVSDPPPST